MFFPLLPILDFLLSLPLPFLSLPRRSATTLASTASTSCFVRGSALPSCFLRLALSSAGTARPLSVYFLRSRWRRRRSSLSACARASLCASWRMPRSKSDSLEEAPLPRRGFLGLSSLEDEEEGSLDEGTNLRMTLEVEVEWRGLALTLLVLVLAVLVVVVVRVLVRVVSDPNAMMMTGGGARRGGGRDRSRPRARSAGGGCCGASVRVRMLLGEASGANWEKGRAVWGALGSRRGKAQVDFSPPTLTLEDRALLCTSASSAVCNSAGTRPLLVRPL